MSKKELQAVLFDHDGTLVDSEVMHFELWSNILKQRGHVIEQADYQRYLAGTPTLANAAWLFQHYELSGAIQDLVREKMTQTHAFLSQQSVPLRHDVKDLIVELHRHQVSKAVVTGSSRADLNESLNAHQLASFFNTTITHDDVKRNKPSPEGYELGLFRLNVAAEHAIAIEDTEVGLAAATAAGLDCIAVPTAWSMQQNFSQAVFVAKSIGEARLWILEHYDLPPVV